MPHKPLLVLASVILSCGIFSGCTVHVDDPAVPPKVDVEIDRPNVDVEVDRPRPNVDVDVDVKPKPNP